MALTAICSSACGSVRGGLHSNAHRVWHVPDEAALAPVVLVHTYLALTYTTVLRFVLERARCLIGRVDGVLLFFSPFLSVLRHMRKLQGGARMDYDDIIQ